MKIAICGSMSFSPEMMEIKNQLVKLSHEISLPEFTEQYAKLNSRDDMHVESTQNKIQYDLIRGYYDVIRKSDAVLIYNGIENYVGGNTLIEMAFAHVLNKKLFMYNPIPNMSYSSEMEAMKPVIIKRDLKKII